MRFYRNAALGCLLCIAGAYAAQPSSEPILRIEAGMHSGPVRRISVDRAQRFLLSASMDKTARIWDLKTGALLRVLRPPIGSGNEGQVNSVALSPDGEIAAVAGWIGYEWRGSHSVYLFDRRTGAILRRIPAIPNVAYQLIFSKDGQRLAVGVWGQNGLRVFNVSDGSLQFSDTNYGGDVYGIDFDGAGRLVAGSYDGHVRLYDSRGRQIAKQKAPHGMQVYGVSFSPDASRVAIGYVDTNAVDVLSGSDLSPLFSPDTSGTSGALHAVRWTSDGRELAAAGTYWRAGFQQLRRWSDAGRGPPEDQPAAPNTVMDLQALDDGAFAFSSFAPSLGILGRNRQLNVLQPPPLADHRGPVLRASEDGTLISFAYVANGGDPATFSVSESALRLAPPPGLPAPSKYADGLAVTSYENSTAPKLNGQPLRMDINEIARSLSVAPGGQSFLLGAQFWLRQFDRGGNEMWKRPAAGECWAVTHALQGKLAIAAFGDGTVRWYRTADGQELLAFFPHADRKRWVLWTPSGYYEASAGGEDLIGWLVNRGEEREADFFPAARFRTRFYRPDVVSRMLSALDESTALAQADAEGGRKMSAPSRLVLPPVVRILSPGEGDAFTGSSVRLRITVRSPGGAKITVVRPLVDGRPVGEQRGVKKKESEVAEGEMTLDVPLPPRDCTVGVLAEAGESIGEPDRIHLRWTPPAIAERNADKPAPAVDTDFLPKLYVLAIGVSNYKNTELHLDYPAKDAKDIARVLKSQKGKLYRAVETKVLTDEDATRDGIEDGLDWLKKQTTSRDVAVLFLAGHGVNDPSNGMYRYLPVGAKIDRASTLLPGSTIKETLASIAGKAVVMLDTCHSGNVLGDKKLRDAADGTRFVNELTSAESGVVVFTAATGRQSSQESKKWGNGAFTKALVEALSGKADARKTGRVTVNMIDLYVSERVKELTGGEQTPVTAKPGGVPDFPLTSGGRGDAAE